MNVLSILNFFILGLLLANGVGIYIMYTKYHNLLNKIHIISDTKPKKRSAQAKAMKLSNELEQYIKCDGDSIYIKVLD